MKVIARTVKRYLLMAMVGEVLGSIALCDAIPVTGRGRCDAVPEETISTDRSRKAPGLVPHEEHGLPQPAVPVLKKLGRLPIARQRTEARFHEKLGCRGRFHQLLANSFAGPVVCQVPPRQKEQSDEMPMAEHPL